MQVTEFRQETTNVPNIATYMFEVAMMAMDGRREDTNWYLDFSATKHVTGDSKTMHDLHIVGDYKVGSAGGHFHQVKGKNIVFTYNGEIKRINNVFYVYGVTKNLLFVGSIADKRCVVMFNSNECWIVDSNSTDIVLTRGKRDPINGLYKLESNSDQLHVCIIDATKNVDVWYE